MCIAPDKESGKIVGSAIADYKDRALDFRQTLCETLWKPLRTHQMLSLRSLAFILASAIRRALSLSCAAVDRSPDRNSGRKMATKMAAKIATKVEVASMSVSCEEFTALRETANSFRSPACKLLAGGQAPKPYWVLFALCSGFAPQAASFGLVD
jgi:hypothetical protein